MIDGMDCVYISTTFAPRFLYGFSNSMIQTRYVEPVLTDMQLASIVFSPEIDWQNQVLACMHRIYDLSLSQPSAFEMEIQELLDYIHRHYMEHLTLEDLAAQIHICRSECCRFFKKCMNESLFDYLLDYRIEKSLPLLLERQASITSVAEQTGFSSPAYFSKIFRQQMGCSPSEYRNRADHT